MEDFGAVEYTGYIGARASCRAPTPAFQFQIWKEYSIEAAGRICGPVHSHIKKGSAPRYGTTNFLSH